MFRQKKVSKIFFYKRLFFSLLLLISGVYMDSYYKFIGLIRCWFGDFYIWDFKVKHSKIIQDPFIAEVNEFDENTLDKVSTWHEKNIHYVTL